jgi:hypothetical protein
LKKIHIEIGELALHGFYYHNYKRIAAALELELSRLVTEKGLPENWTRQQQNRELSKIDAGRFKVSRSMSPTSIGNQVAQSIYRSCSKTNAEFYSK